MKNSYDLYKNDEYVGTYSARVIAEMCGVEANRINAFADNNRPFAGDYRCEVVDTIPNKNEMLAVEWDDARAKLLKVKRPQRNRKYFIKEVASAFYGNRKIRLLCRVMLETNEINYSVVDKTKEYMTTDDYGEAISYLNRIGQQKPGYHPGK